MDLTHFIDQRRPQWQELQGLLETVEGSGLRALDPDQAVQFATLYRRAASDLNQAQTFITGEGTVQYLNDLVARCYFLIHARKDPKLGTVLWGMISGYPVVFRRCLPHFLLATALFVVGAVFGFAASYFDSKTARSFLLPTAMPTIEPGQERGVISTGNLAAFSGFLFRHNVSVTLVAFAMGMTFGLGTAWLMFENGVLVGALGAVFVEAGAFMEFSTGILPHGVLEIPACLLGGAGGFVLAQAMLRAPWPRLQELGNRGKEALTLVAGCVPLLAVAAFIEAVVARAPDALIDSGLKLAVAAVFAAAFVAYLALVGRKKKQTT